MGKSYPTRGGKQLQYRGNKPNPGDKRHIHEFFSRDETRYTHTARGCWHPQFIEQPDDIMADDLGPLDAPAQPAPPLPILPGDEPLVVRLWKDAQRTYLQCLSMPERWRGNHSRRDPICKVGRWELMSLSTAEIVGDIAIVWLTGDNDSDSDSTAPVDCRGDYLAPITALIQAAGGTVIGKDEAWPKCDCCSTTEPSSYTVEISQFGGECELEKALARIAELTEQVARAERQAGIDLLAARSLGHEGDSVGDCVTVAAAKHREQVAALQQRVGELEGKAAKAAVPTNDLADGQLAELTGDWGMNKGRVVQRHGRDDLITLGERSGQGYPGSARSNARVRPLPIGTKFTLTDQGLRVEPAKEGK